jgi:large conductance mechanosensitive channel
MKIWKEFKEFAFKGNVIDLAVGVIIGAAFTGIVNSLVNDIFMPLISIMTQGADFTKLGIKLGEGEDAALFAYGNFIQAVINFLLVATCIFIFIKFVNTLKRQPAPAPAKEARKCPFCFGEVNEKATRCPHCTSMIEVNE